MLSGGGAKGLAHIGALKIIDSLGIRVDYVGGTSMGAIIGSLYSSGYTGKQIDSIFKKTDLNVLIQDELPRSAKTFYEKEDAERYAITLPFDSFKVTFPSSISKGQNVYNKLAELLLHVENVDDFSKLPIPFLCIASDIEKGEQVVLESGYLPDAITASGAFPSLFEPIPMGERLLIDGGVTNNYPIDEIKAKNVDIIIGVDVQDGLADREKLQSAPSILTQINNFRTINAMKVKSKQTDVYIRPNINGFSVIAFDKGRELIDRGEAAGREQIEVLKSVAERQQQKRSLLPVKRRDSIAINYIHLRGNENFPRSYVRGKLRFKTPTKIPFKKFTEGIGNLAATGNFAGIRYQRIKSSDGKDDMILNLREKPNTMFLRLAAHYDDVYKTAGLINVTKKKLLFKNDVASLDFIIGDNIRYNFEYYIDKGYYWSIGLKSRFNTFERGINYDLISDDTSNPNLNRIDVEVSDFTNQLYIANSYLEKILYLSIRCRAHKRLEVRLRNYRQYVKSKMNLMFESTVIIGSAFGNLRLDTYDNKYFPNKRMYFFNGDFHTYLYCVTDFNTETFEPFFNCQELLHWIRYLVYHLNLSFKSYKQEVGSNSAIIPGTTSLDFVHWADMVITSLIILLPFYGYDFLISLTGR